MADKLKYVLWGLAMLVHALYILNTGIVSFGWDMIEMHGMKLYLIVVPYFSFALWVIIYSIFYKNKEGTEGK